MKITLGQYQQLYLIPTGITTNEYTQKVLDIFGIDPSEMNVQEVRKFIESLKIPVDKPKEKLKIRINGKRYGVVKDIMSSTYNEFLQFESVYGVSDSEADLIKNLHKLLGVYVRPMKGFIFKRLAKLDEIDVEKNQEEMRNLSIEEAISINNFFYSKEIDFIQRMRISYLNRLNQQLNRDIKSK